MLQSRLAPAPSPLHQLKKITVAIIRKGKTQKKKKKKKKKKEEGKGKAFPPYDYEARELSMQTKYIYVFDKLQRSLYYNSQGW
jgi:hypothetical protein